MSITSDQYEKIVDFLDENMTPEEKKTFLSEVALSQELLEELEWERVLRGKDDIPLPLTEPNEKKNSGLLLQLLSHKWLVAAAILIFLIGTVLLMKQKAAQPAIVKDKPGKKQDSSIQKIKDRQNPLPPSEIDYQLAYNQVYKKFKSPADLPSDLENVSLAYQQNDYNRVILESNDISLNRGQSKADKSVKSYAGLYKGIALMELNETKKAIAALRKAAEFTSPGKLHDDLIWYTALCYLKEKNKKDCVKFLNMLKNSSKEKEASVLLMKLTTDL